MYSGVIDNYVQQLQEDLLKKLNHLNRMRYDPSLHVAEHFAELRRQVDLDAEKLLSEIESVKHYAGNAPKEFKVNETRLELIRILDELEKRTGLLSKPQVASSEFYASLEKKINAFKDSTRSLDELEDSYVQLVHEIINETNELEKSIFGEQTIVYLPSKDPNRLDSLVYFGDIFLNPRQVESFM